MRQEQQLQLLQKKESYTRERDALVAQIQGHQCLHGVRVYEAPPTMAELEKAESLKTGPVQPDN